MKVKFCTFQFTNKGLMIPVYKYGSLEIEDNIITANWLAKNWLKISKTDILKIEKLNRYSPFSPPYRIVYNNGFLYIGASKQKIDEAFEKYGYKVTLVDKWREG